MTKTLEQLQSYLQHYQSSYSTANKTGKTVIQSHLNKLSRQIQRLQSDNEKPSGGIQVLVNNEFRY